jgi:hypothetical protein
MQCSIHQRRSFTHCRGAAAGAAARASAAQGAAPLPRLPGYVLKNTLVMRRRLPATLAPLVFTKDSESQEFCDTFR